MNIGRLIQINLRYYWRRHVGVVLGAAVATAVLTGALLVGDSVRYSLKQIATSRLGRTQIAMVGENRFFRAKLAEELSEELQVEAAPVLQLSGMIVHNENQQRRNRIQVLGVDQRFWRIGDSKDPFGNGTDEIVLNEPLAAYLKVRVGDKVKLRVQKPHSLPGEAMLSLGRDLSKSADVKVAAIVSDAEFGRFDLRANQLSPLNAFVRLDWLSRKINAADRANVLLLGGKDAQAIPVEQAERALAARWDLADAGLSLRRLERQGALELRTRRIFMEPAVAKAAMQVDASALGVFSYLVNELRSGKSSAPYSIVSAVGGLSLTEGLAGADAGKDMAAVLPTALGQVIPSDLGEDEIIINEWLARDLLSQRSGAKPVQGYDIDKLRQELAAAVITLRYYVMGPGRTLQEPPAKEFRIRDVLPMEPATVDPDLMPDFPGLSDAENCDQWEAGIDIDLSRIRKPNQTPWDDETYWDLYRGTPKAFITLRAGQELWANRFGNLTAIRYSLDAVDQNKVEQTIRNGLSPGAVGLSFVPVGRLGEKAGGEALDFGMLFLGLSLFLIAAALVLLGLLFVFGIEQRGEEVGTLLALGYTIRRVRWLLLLEGGVLSMVGGLLGVFGSIVYTQVTLWALSTVWRGAIAGAGIQYHARPMTLLTGFSVSVIMATGAMWVTLWRQGRQPIKELLSGLRESIIRFKEINWDRCKLTYRDLCLIALGSVAIIMVLPPLPKVIDVWIFFLVGVSLLFTGIFMIYFVLNPWARDSKLSVIRTLGDLGLRNSCRRRGRSLAVVILLAVGSFMVFAVGANRHNAEQDARKRSSGTGGFALLGETSLPILHDVDTIQGRDAIGLDEEKVRGARFVSFRMRPGDDASCLNLNRAQRPQLLGVNPERLAERKAFRFVKTIEDVEPPWQLLNRKYKSREKIVPAIADHSTIQWALGKKVGDVLAFTDEMGNRFQIQFVAGLANSVLQGNIIISEEEFLGLYPSEVGYRLLLIDVPQERRQDIREALERAGRNYGLELTPTTERLAAIYAVENTYLEIFQLLGGLGMLLGSVGLALVVIRNVMERRGELAMLRAVGMDRSDLVKLLLYEHWWLLVIGLLWGTASALVAVLPALRSGGNTVSYIELAVILLLLFGNGLFWIWLAARWALRGKLVPALRNE